MPIELPPDLPRRRRLRLAGFDYAAPGAYFVTICTEGRRCILAEVDSETVRLSSLGTVVFDTWSSLPVNYPGVALDAFVVMPNHVHGIFMLGESAPALPKVMNGFKSFSTRSARALVGSPLASLWQRSYHEHVIRDDDALGRIREYIANNPAKWHVDRENPVNNGRAARRAGREAGPYK